MPPKLECAPEDDVPSGNRIFGDAFAFNYTRNEFLGNTHKILSKLYHEPGICKNEEACKAHYQLAINYLTDGGNKVGPSTGKNAIPAAAQKQIAQEKEGEKVEWGNMEGVKIIELKEYSWDTKKENGTGMAYVKLPEGIESTNEIKYINIASGLIGIYQFLSC